MFKKLTKKHRQYKRKIQIELLRMKATLLEAKKYTS